MKTSIVVCTYNRGHAVLNCLSSIETAINKAEAASDAEVIIVNNASTDNTAQILQSWVQDKPFRAQIVLETKQGISYARNAGLRTVTGQYIACIDDDCVMDENYIVNMRSHFANDPELCLRGGRVELGDPNDLPLSIKTSQEKKSWKKPMSVADEGKLLGGAIIGCNVTMQKEVIDRVGLYDEGMAAGKIPAAEDSDLFYRTYLEDIKIEYVPDMLVKHFHGRKTDEQRKKLLTNYTIGNGALAYKYLFIYPNFSRHIVWQTISCLKRWGRMFQENDDKPHLHPLSELVAFYKGIFYYIFTVQLIKPFR